MKTCFKCLCAKPLTEFYKHAAMGDGHLNKCKECTKKDANANRQENLERLRYYEKSRSSMPHRIAAQAARTRKYRNEYPNRRKANAMVARALRAGTLKKQPCWVCGAAALAHHPDYDRPLDVVWLCQPHHKQAHALVANQPNMGKQA